MDIRFYLSLFMRRIHWFLFFVILGATAGIIFAKALPAVYVSRALLLVESQQIPGNLAESTVQTAATEQLQIIQQRILTRETLLDMASRLNIYTPQNGFPQAPASADARVADLRSRIAFSVQGGGGDARRGPVGATLVTISVDAPTADLSATLANDMVTRVLREDVSMRTTTARQTLQFFEQEVARLESQLADKNAEILKFKEANRASLPEGIDYRRSQLAALQPQIDELQRGLDALSLRRDRMVRQHDAIRQLNGVEVGPDSAFARSLSDIDLQINDLQGRKAGLESQREEHQLAIDAAPSVAGQLEALERDYSLLQSQYSQASANRSQAQTGDTIEALSKGQRIAVIENAVAPIAPTKPNRKLIAAGGVGAGAALGFVLVMLVGLLSPAVRRPIELSNKLGIAPLAVLPRVNSPRDSIRRWLSVAGSGFFLLAVMLLALWLVDQTVMPLEALIGQLR